ncbi:MAG: hypothetical protein EOO41_02495, partial [Methanobacteriota archaeon]
MLVRMLHAVGMNVRHLGMLRVRLGDEDGELSRHSSRSTKERIVLQRLRGMMLTEMVTRTVKQLLRDALRSMADAVAQVGGASAAASEEDTKVAIIRHCLNHLLTQTGAWSTSTIGHTPSLDGTGAAGYRAAVAAPSPHAAVASEREASAVMWNTVIRTHIQVKFGSQMPALSLSELNPEYDLRQDVVPAALAAALCEQLGLDIPDAVRFRLLSIGSSIREHVHLGSLLLRTAPTSGVPATGASNAQLHDPVLLPRVMVPISMLEYFALQPAPPARRGAGADVSDADAAAKIMHSCIGVPMKILRDTGSKLRSALQSIGSSLARGEPIRSTREPSLEQLQMWLSAPLKEASGADVADAATLLARMFGVNYGYTAALV